MNFLRDSNKQIRDWISAFRIGPKAWLPLGAEATSAAGLRSLRFGRPARSLPDGSAVFNPPLNPPGAA